MKIISPKIHGIIDYLVVIFLLASPTLFGFTGFIATFTYALAGIHLLLTILTNYNAGLLKIIPLPLHGLVELIVGIVLIILAYKIFSDTQTGKIFYACFGLAVLLVWLLSDYNYHKVETKDIFNKE
jgi:hypothetical protein